MFDSGNIQGYPIPELYQRRGLTVRTWNVPAKLDATLSEASYLKVSFNGSLSEPEQARLEASLDELIYLPSESGTSNSEKVSLDASLTETTYTATIFDGGETNEQVNVSANLMEAVYDHVIFDGQATSPEAVTLSTSLTELNYAVI